MRIKSAYIEITNACNLNCQTCYNRSGMNAAFREIPLARIQETARFLWENGCAILSLSGGEPFLHSEIDDVLRWMHNEKEHYFALVSNGTLLTKNQIKLIAQSPNITLQISLDGPDEETNAKTRGTGSFSKTLTTVNSLCENGKAATLRMVVSKLNHKSVERFYRMAIRLKCEPSFGFVTKQGRGSDHWENLDLSVSERMDVVHTIRRLNQEYDLKVEEPGCTYKCALTDPDDEWHILIKSNGSFQPCQSLYREDFSLGNIDCLDAQALMFHAQHIAQIAREREKKDLMCHNCLLDGICGKGCMAAAVDRTGDFHGNDGECMFRKVLFLNNTFQMHRNNL